MPRARTGRYTRHVKSAYLNAKLDEVVYASTSRTITRKDRAQGPFVSRSVSIRGWCKQGDMAEGADRDERMGIFPIER